MLNQVGRKICTLLLWHWHPANYKWKNIKSTIITADYYCGVVLFNTSHFITRARVCVFTYGFSVTKQREAVVMENELFIIAKA